MVELKESLSITNSDEIPDVPVTGDDEMNTKLQKQYLRELAREKHFGYTRE
jgi:hypothetical protein